MAATTLLPGNILYGGPCSSNEARRCNSVGHFILKKLKSHGNQILMINASTDDRYTAKYIYDSSVRLAYVLRHLGIQANDVVGICSENSIEYVIAFVAALALNASVFHMNVTYSEGEIKHAIDFANPKIVFGSTKSIEKIHNVTKEREFVKDIINLDAKENNMKIHSLHQLLTDTSIPAMPDITPQETNKNEDIALILCSSGTTGIPKGVLLTQNNILGSFDGLLDSGESIKTPDLNVVLNILPWCHIYGNSGLLFYLIVGKIQVYMPRYEGKQFLGAIERYHVNIALLVPPLMVFLAKSPFIKDYNLTTMKVIICGAASLKSEIIEEVNKRTSGAFILQGYGLTETSSAIVGQSPTSFRPDSIGVLKPEMYAKVIDTETGKTLGFNLPGELCFKGYAIMKGYIGDTVANTNTIIDGWLHTGDIGYYNENFEFFIVDRLKELIKYKGNQVPPAELEAILLKNDNIIDAAVVGKPDEEAGELPLAFVVKRPNSEITEQEIIQYVADHVSNAKRLRGGVVFVNEIPKTTTGKILRRELRQMISSSKSKL